ncbi:MAG: hypothetical protein KIS68_08645 [Bauldia sp.]|nr:hypothetical protein [Bauldia sp.]
MPSTFFYNATTEDIDAIIAYLRTKVDWMAAFGMIPPVENDVPKPPMQNAPAME